MGEAVGDVAALSARKTGMCLIASQPTTDLTIFVEEILHNVVGL